LAGLIRLKGFMLMESVFSMITIMICFGICMMVFNTVTSGTTGALTIHARIRLHEEAEKCKAGEDFTDAVIVSEQFVIERSFVPWNDESSLTEMKFTARNAEGKIIAEYHELLVR
jgi:hypothetical protein